MPRFNYPFAFTEEDTSQVTATLELDEPLPFETWSQGSGFYRPARLTLGGGCQLDIVLYHSEATSTFIYNRAVPIDHDLLAISGLSPEEIASINSLTLPGQLCLGALRARLIGKAMKDIFAAPPMQQMLAKYHQDNLAVFPIAREGLKYQVTEAIFENYGFYCDEVVLDAHHVFDSSVPVYNRKVTIPFFKDKDLDKQQRENIAVAFIADSIASGLVMKEVIERVKERFDHIQRVEVIAPLATVRGLCRIARFECSANLGVRVHVFETLLKALPPDYYYSAHFSNPEFHIRPDLEEEYRAWWGRDAEGNFIADTACAGYGWSEVFYSPRKQIRMINDQLEMRHGLTIAEIIRRNIR